MPKQQPAPGENQPPCDVGFTNDDHRGNRPPRSLQVQTDECRKHQLVRNRIGELTEVGDHLVLAGEVVVRWSVTISSKDDERPPTVRPCGIDILPRLPLDHPRIWGSADADIARTLHVKVTHKRQTRSAYLVACSANVVSTLVILPTCRIFTEPASPAAFASDPVIEACFWASSTEAQHGRITRVTR